jgi:uncharacterized protein (TIGR02678 family)
MSDETLRLAARALLKGGYLSSDDAVGVRRQRRRISEIFRDDLGWQVTADDNGPVRALCTPGAGHVPRGLTNRSGRAFDPRRYALLFLVLASLEAAGARTTLRLLFADVCSRAGGIETLDFDKEQAAARRSFVHAVQAAVDLGILELTEGAEEDFAARGEGDALYRVDRERLTRLLATSKPPSLAAGPDAAVAEDLYTSTEDGQRRQRRHRILRALVCEPVVYRSDLTDAELDYLTSQESRIRRLLDEVFGLDLETRAEGWVSVDTGGDLSDEKFPAITPARAAALAIVDESGTRRRGSPTAEWTAGELAGFVAGLTERFGSSWPVQPDNTEATTKLAAEAAAVLIAVRLAEATDGGGITVLPAAGRFALVNPVETEQVEAGLFDTEPTL